MRRYRRRHRRKMDPRSCCALLKTCGIKVAKNDFDIREKEGRDTAIARSVAPATSNRQVDGQELGKRTRDGVYYCSR